MGRVVHSHGLASVVVLVIDCVCVFSDKRKRDLPVSADLYGPRAFAVTFQRVKSQSGESHILGCCRCAKPAQNESQPLCMLRLNAGFRSALEKPDQALMFEAADHTTECNLSSDGLQGAQRIVERHPRRRSGSEVRKRGRSEEKGSHLVL